MVYFGFTVLAGALALAIHKVTIPAVIYGLMANLRYLGFFLMVVLVASRSNWLNSVPWKHLVVIAGDICSRLWLFASDIIAI